MLRIYFVRYCKSTGATYCTAMVTSWSAEFLQIICSLILQQLAHPTEWNMAYWLLTSTSCYSYKKKNKGLSLLYGNKLIKPTEQNKVLQPGLVSNWWKLEFDKRNFWWACCERDESEINAQPNKMTPQYFSAATVCDRQSYHAADSRRLLRYSGQPDKMWHMGPTCPMHIQSSRAFLPPWRLLPVPGTLQVLSPPPPPPSPQHSSTQRWTDWHHFLF